MINKLYMVLNNRNQILLKIIELISQEERWYSVKEISSDLDLVERSTQRYISIMYEFIEEYTIVEDRSFTLMVKKSKGLKLIVAHNANLALLRNYIYKNDENIQVLMALLLEDYTSVNEYAQKNSLGKNTVLSSLKKVEKLLNEFDLSIIARSFSIEGEEHQIRAVIYGVSWSLFSLSDMPEVFKKFDLRKISLELEKMTENLYLNIGSVKKRELLFLVVINIMRYRKKHEVTLKSSWDPYLFKGNDSQIIVSLEEIYSNHQIFSSSETHYLALIMTMRPYFYNTASLRNYIIKMHRTSNSDILAMTELFMEEFSDSIYAISEEKYEPIFIEVFRSHLFAKIYKDIGFDYSANDYFSFVTENYPNYTKKFNSFIDSLYKKSGNDLFLEKRFLLQRYFFVLSTVKESASYERDIKIYLRISGPKMFEEEVKDYIYSFFRRRFNIEFIDRNYLQLPDLILTNIVAKPADEKTIVINYPLNKRDLDTIEHFLKDCYRV